MENKAHRNPVFAHLTRNARWPSARATLWLAAGLILASLALNVFLMTCVTPSEDYLSLELLLIVLLIAIWGLHLVMPLVAGPLAAILTVRETQGESFQLLRVTPGYSSGGAVRGLVLGALYRLRVPLAFMVALSPLMMVEPYRWDRYWANPDHGCYVFVSHEEYEEWVEMEESVLFAPTPDMCIEPSDRRLLWKSFVILLFPVGLWGATLFSAAFAVWLGLRWGRVGWVWVYLVGWPLCVMAFSTPLLSVMLSSFSEMLGYRTTTTLWPPPLLYAVVLFSVVFYMLAWGVMRLARRWA